MPSLARRPGRNYVRVGRKGRGYPYADFTIPVGVMVAWPNSNASIPSGWARATAYDGRYVSQIVNSVTDPGSTGGGTAHNHTYGSHSDHSVSTHVHTYGNSSCTAVGTSRNGGTTNHYPDPHNHTETGANSLTVLGGGGPANYNCTTAEPPFLQVVFIKSDGSPSGLPTNGLAFINAAAPTGWTQYSNATNRMLKGAGTGGDGGGTGGTGCSHTHPSSAHTHTINHTHTVTLNDTSVGGASSNAACTTALYAHTHSATTACVSCGTSSSVSECALAGDVTPPWQKLLIVQNTGASATPVGIIAMWDNPLATIPKQWKNCDGTGGTPNCSQGLLVRGAANSGEVGNAGGSSTHTHPGSGHSHTNPGGSHTHGSVTSSSNNASIHGSRQCCCSGAAPANHNHTTGVSGAATPNGLASRTTNAPANTSNLPTYSAVAYIQFTG